MNLAIFGSRKDIARSIPAEGEQLIAVFGEAKYDLSNVVLPEALSMSALAMFGSCKIYVPRGTDVVFRGFAMFGAQEHKNHDPYPAGEVRSVLYLNAVALFGSVEVVEVGRVEE